MGGAAGDGGSCRSHCSGERFLGRKVLPPLSSSSTDRYKNGSNRFLGMTDFSSRRASERGEFSLSFFFFIDPFLISFCLSLLPFLFYIHRSFPSRHPIYTSSRPITNLFSLHKNRATDGTRRPRVPRVHASLPRERGTPLERGDARGRGAGAHAGGCAQGEVGGGAPGQAGRRRRGLGNARWGSGWSVCVRRAGFGFCRGCG